MLTRSQFDHRLRWLRQKLTSPTVGVIGGYHSGNLGDMALGTVCAEYLRAAGISADLQTIYSLPKWPKCKFAILGGGAIGYRPLLRNVQEKYGDSPERVMFLGVDFNDELAVREFAPMLRRAAMITCRSQAQADQMKSLVDRPDVTYHPDLAFALRSFAKSLSVSHPTTRRILGVNCTTFFWIQRGSQYAPGSAWEHEIRERMPHLVPWISELGPRYVDAFQKVLRQARREGWEIWHVPFSPEDHKFCQHFFAAHIDRFVPYSPDPLKILRMFGSFSRFLPTRFHSLVFALLSNVPVIPFCHAEKTERLFTMLGLSNSLPITARELAVDSEVLASSWQSPLCVDRDAVDHAEQQVRSILGIARDRIGAILEARCTV